MSVAASVQTAGDGKSARGFVVDFGWPDELRFVSASLVAHPGYDVAARDECGTVRKQSRRVQRSRVIQVASEREALRCGIVYFCDRLKSW